MSLENFEQSLDGFYRLISTAFQGNNRVRFRGTPYLSEAEKEGRLESIASHEASCGKWWSVMRRLCPSLDALVDSVKVYEILINHDLGEVGTQDGDVTRFNQLSGVGLNKYHLEYDALWQMSCGLPPAIQSEILTRFEEFETSSGNNNIEILVARLVDSLEGDFFALTFGGNFSHYTSSIQRIVESHTLLPANRLMDLLQQKDEYAALVEVEKVVSYHLGLFERVGVKIDWAYHTPEV